MAQAALAEFNSWRDSNATGAELESWRRVLLHSPTSDDVLALGGMTRAEHDAILAAIPEPTAADMAAVDALTGRVPHALLPRLRADD